MDQGFHSEEQSLGRSRSEREHYSSRSGHGSRSERESRHSGRSPSRSERKPHSSRPERRHGHSHRNPSPQHHNDRHSSDHNNSNQAYNSNQTYNKPFPIQNQNYYLERNKTRLSLSQPVFWKTYTSDTKLFQKFQAHLHKVLAKSSRSLSKDTSLGQVAPPPPTTATPSSPTLNCVPLPPSSPTTYSSDDDDGGPGSPSSPTHSQQQNSSSLTKAPFNPSATLKEDKLDEKKRFGGQLMPGEGSAIAAYVASGQRIPRRGEIGLDSSTIESFEKVGYVMSGSRHHRMNAVRLRKENQVISSEEKRTLLRLYIEEKSKKESQLVSDFRQMVNEKLKYHGTSID